MKKFTIFCFFARNRKNSPKIIYNNLKKKEFLVSKIGYYDKKCKKSKIFSLKLKFFENVVEPFFLN